MRRAAFVLALALVAGCAHGRRPFPTTDTSLGLDRVVLYRNGVGYFERRGEVRGDTLVLKVRKDQVNDVLKSLTVIDRARGEAVSVSMPLDPQTWANAAMATLAPGQGSLAEVLDALRGTAVVLGTTRGKVRGRIAMVEAIVDEPDPSPPSVGLERGAESPSGSRDFKVTVLDGRELRVVRLSKVKSVTLKDGDLALGFHRSLDASAGEGMFEQIAVEIHLAGAAHHDLVVSYVVAAPVWKPTYRVVLPKPGSDAPALLQGWAVVDNTSGEEWRRVKMSLTSGAPIAFRYDLHTPRQIERSDLTERGVAKRAEVAIGEATYASDSDGDGLSDAEDQCPDAPETYNGFEDEDGCPDMIPEQVSAFTGVIRGINFSEKSARIDAKSGEVLDRALALLLEFPAIRLEIAGHTSPGEPAGLGQRRAEEVRAYLVRKGIDASRLDLRDAGEDEPIDDNSKSSGRAKNRRIEFTILSDTASAPPPPPRTPKARPDPSRVAPRPDRSAELADASGPAVDLEALRRSTAASARSRSVSGLTSFDLRPRVTVPDGSSTMLAIVNEEVEAEQTFLYRPGGAGTGYEQNPYRVVRFRNTTPFILEPGPISIYAGGSFVGEGISEAVGAGVSTTVPFAVEPSILVSSTTSRASDEMRLVRIVRGVLEVESFQRVVTTWTVKARAKPKGYTVLVRHPKQGGAYTLKSKIDGVEEVPDAYLVPVKVAANVAEAALEVVEQTPTTSRLSIWESKAPELLDAALQVSGGDPALRAKIEPLVRMRQAIGRIDTELEGLRRQQAELYQRAAETRVNLEAIKKDPKATELRGRLSKRLDELAREGDAIGRRLVELQSERLGQKIELEDALQELDLSLAAP